MNRDPKTQDHPLSVYLNTIFVLCMVLFVLAGVINQLAFSSDGPGLLIPLVKKFEKKESPVLIAQKQHRRAEEHRRFHHIVDYPKAPEALQPTCVICHSNLPHSKNKKIRSLLNMHSNFLTCETCHLQTTEGETLLYKWYSPVEKDPKGPFFGTAYDPKTGELEMADDQFSKIAPFLSIGGKDESTVHMQNVATAKDYVRIRGQLTPEKREALIRRFHLDVKPKGLSCQACHAKNGILDFRKLGFSQNRIVDLENLNITGMITKYNVFYLPDLLQKPMETEPDNQGGQ